MSEEVMNKERWVEVFVAAGLDEPQMRRWHAEFERRYPAGHRDFLEWLGLPAAEVAAIRSDIG
ncbi:hypothetical protein [Thioalbus denitrificans]|uniref:Uncharacterized protein n=1 Tax=Thioalbus denitrificans TaxID=547122 RepID=A0A369CNB1_9GAMM|nr:hypothetical protein [Thioalbus denitrificans]RCX33344.1 hypothetical protein DFQ59_101645 [Thioalbus denitrificans]